MPSPQVPTLDLRRLLDRAEAASPVEAIDVMADEMAAMLSATDVWFWITDLSGRAVARFGGTDANVAGARSRRNVPVVELSGTVYEAVLRHQRPELHTDRAGSRLIVPVTDRGDVMGVVELLLPLPPDEAAIASIAAAARALAYVVVGSRRHTDLFEWAQRSTPFSLAAEIQRRLLPSAFTCEAGQFTVSGWLEPANAVGGDTFDYALDRDSLHVSITDAVGHDVTAALLATVLVGSLRNGRRHRLDLHERAVTANDALVAHSRPGEFVTGQLVSVDRRTARLSVVNAGHPLPYRVRDGEVSANHSRSTSLSGSTPATSSGCSTSTCATGTGSSWSPTGFWNATPRSSTSRPSSPPPRTGIPVSWSTSWGRKSWRRRAVTCATTPPSCAWTGTVGRRTEGRPSSGPIRDYSTAGSAIRSLWKRITREWYRMSQRTAGGGAQRLVEQWPPWPPAAANHVLPARAATIAAIDTNLGGVFHAVRAVSPHMIARRSGRIVATSSQCGRRGVQNLGAYTATKWGVIGLVKTAAIELGRYGITVNALCPSYVDTKMINFDAYHRLFRPDLDAPDRETSDDVLKTQHTLPVGSYPAQHVSDALLYLVSDGAAMVSGTALDVTAGMSTLWSA